MSDMAAAGNDGGQQDAGQQQAGPDLAGLASQMESLTSGQEELRQFMQQFTAQPQEQPQEQADAGLDLSFLQDQYADPSGFDPETLAQNLAPSIESLVQQRLAEAIKPFQQEAETSRLTREFGALVDEFPDLADAEVHQPVLALSKQLAQQMNRPELGDEPAFIRMAYMAGRAAETANNEGRDVPGAAHLEGGGGATPAGSQVNPADLFGQGPQRGGSVLPF